MPDPSLPPIPTLKRPRSSSNPPSPTGSSSSKKAASEDVVSSPTLVPDVVGRIDISPLSNSILVDTSSAMTGIIEPDNVAADDMRTDVDSGSEWVKRTEDVHLNEEGANGDAVPDLGLGREKYEELYNTLLSSSPPPFRAWDRYYIVPCKLRDDLKAAAFNDDTSGNEVKLDMTPLLAGTEGQEVYAIDTQTQMDGTAALIAKGKKERVWSLQLGQLEDEDFLYITEAGWKTISSALGAETGPSLSRFCLPGDKIQLNPPIYTLHQVQLPSSGAEPAAIEPPIRFTCPTETPIPIFARLLRSLLADSTSTIDKSSAYRVWQFDTLLTTENNDAAAQAALHACIVQPALVPALASKLVAWSRETDVPDTCSSRGFENGDSFILEFGKKLRGDEVDWVLDITPSMKAVVKPTINLPPVPTAPAPLFSQPAKFPGSTPSTSTSQTEGSNGGFGMTTRAQTKKAVKTRGLVGLVNLGNTCFMNSATQCLSNTAELNDYFLSGVYQEELNRDNPLGMSGQVAESFGGVIEALWSPHPTSSFSPRQLKHTTSRFAPQFAGYGQHDTQEFIAFLLDGLHEDLNRIQKKPYVEKPDWKAGGGNKELAELGKECWGGYKKRNDSVIVDLFQGQLMSTLVCPECHKESITMDPFMYLTVPLPIAQHREFSYQFVPRDPGQAVVKGKVLIPANASFSQVKDKLAVLMKCNSNNLLGFDLWKNSMYSWLIDSDHNGESKPSDVAIYHDIGAPTSSTRKSTGTLPSESTITVPVFTFNQGEGFRGRSLDAPSECCLMPFFITITKAEAADAGAVREAIAKGYARFMTEEAYAKMWVPSGSKYAGVPSEADASSEVDGEGENTVKVAEVTTESTGTEGESRPASPLNDIRSNIVQNASSTSLSTLASVRSGKVVPRGDIYKVHVADSSSNESSSSLALFKTKDNTVPMYRGGNPKSASGSWSSLEARKKAKKSLLGRFTGGISSIVGAKDADSDTESPAPNGNGSKDASSPTPVLRAGEAIFVEWSPTSWREYFDTIRPMEEFFDPSIEKEKAKKKEGKPISIEDCLDEFSKEETLGQEDLWFCPICKKHQAATKKLEIYKAPDILVICIKRFGGSRRLSDKLDNLVNFPIEGLDLEGRIGERRVSKELKLSTEEAKEFGMEGDTNESWVYDLYAVDNHFGGLGGGHYTAFCKNKEDGGWYNFDDSRVSPASESAVQSRAAYLLFYRRRTVRPIGGISRVKAEEALSRNPSRAVSPAPSSPALPPTIHNFPSGLRNTFQPPMSSSPADSLLSSSSPMSSDDDRLPSYSAGRYSPQMSSTSTRIDPSLNLDIDSSDDDYLTRNRGGGGIDFVSSGQPYGGTQWGSSSSAQDPGSIRYNFGSGPGQAPPSPPDSDDGLSMEHLRRQAAAHFRTGGEGDLNADHPAEEALAGGVADNVSEVDSLDVMVEGVSKKGRGSGSAEEGLGEEYGVIGNDKEGEEEKDGMEVDSVAQGQGESMDIQEKEKKDV